MKFLIAISVAAGIALTPTTVLAGDLRVRLTGIGEEVGFVRVALFASVSDFDGGKQTAGYFTVARGDEVEVVFANLPPGRYGVSSFHDLNGNAELDTNLLGMPTEPYGFSRDARGNFGPPSFEDLAIELGAESSTLVFELR